MKLRLRHRFFLYLLMLLCAFIIVQTCIFTVVEYMGSRTHPQEPLREEMREVVLSLGLDLLILPMLIALAWWMSNSMLRPVARISRTADRIRGGRFVERIDTTDMPDDEMRHLAEAINAAFEKYSDAVDRLAHFSGHVSHQLRTPMTAIRSSGEVALSRDRSADEYRETLSSILEEINRLSTIVDQLLRLARLEGRDISASFTEIDLGQTASKAVNMYEPLAQDHDLHLTMDTAHGIMVSGDADLLFELIGNLVHNAIRHTPAGGTVHARTYLSEGRAILEVVDSGPGIPRDAADKIFERFHRLPNAGEGTGLGLAIAMDIAHVHGGTIRLDNPGEPGARFKAQFPLS